MSVFIFLKRIILIIIGCTFVSIGTASFLLPSKLSSGGFTGIATILYYFCDFKVGTTILILNIPLFIYSFFKIGKAFSIRSLFTTMLYSKLIDIFSERLVYVEDRFLACIYGGILIGSGLALILKADSSTGGTDLVAHIAVKMHKNAKISSVIVIVDIIVVLANLIAFKTLEIGLYSFIVIWIIGKVIDVVFEGINFCKIVYIISDNYKEISELINVVLDKGATEIYARGTYNKIDKRIIMCVCKRQDVANIKSIAKKVDKKAFVIVVDAREVYGLGFKN